jgi:hypothetical protein
LGKENDDGVLEWNPSQGTCDATYSVAPGSVKPVAQHWLIRAHIPHPGYLVLRLRRYPAWRVHVNGKGVANLPVREDGLITVPVPQGVVEVAVDWTTTPDIRIGWWLSCLSAVALVGLYIFERKGIAAQLSGPLAAGVK